jgi:hypothetical protein
MDLRALIFVPALVGSIIFTFILLLFASSYYLTVLESTATGARDVTWQQGEGITDNFWKPFYLSWLLCLWFGPAYVIGRSLAASADEPSLAIIMPVLVAWLLYPVSQLSSLSSASVWIPLHPQVLARLMQRPGTALGFLALTLPVFALGGLAFDWSFRTEGEWQLLFLGAPLLALAGLLYARLLGRLAFALVFTRDLLARKKRKNDPEPKPRKRVEEPLDSCPEEEPHGEALADEKVATVMSPLDGEVAGYNILMADDPPAPRNRVLAEVVEDDAADEVTHPLRDSTDEPEETYTLDEPASPAPAIRRSQAWTDDDEDATPYDLSPSLVEKEPPPRPAIFEPDAKEVALLTRTEEGLAPKRTWSPDLVSFVLQPGTISALLVISTFVVAAGVMVRLARAFNPVSGGE